MTVLTALALVSGMAASASAGQTAKTEETKAQTIYDVAKVGGFKTLVAAVVAAGLAETLQGKGPFTVFAPTDEAFAKLPKGTLENLLNPENKALLADILKYHVVSGKVTAEQVVKLKSADAVNGQRLPILVEEGSVRIAGATVTKTDIAASNGVIHVIDTVLIPATKSIVGVAQDAGTLRTLIAAAQAAGLAEVLDQQGPFTVFAPSDEAFASIRGTDWPTIVVIFFTVCTFFLVGLPERREACNGGGL